MEKSINKMVFEHFGTGKVSEKMWFIVTDDKQNIAKRPVDEEGCFHPAIMLRGIRSDTKVGAFASFRKCFNTQRVYGVVETTDEARRLMPDSTIIDWNGKTIQK
jgi:hypothetical protein